MQMSFLIEASPVSKALLYRKVNYSSRLSSRKSQTFFFALLKETEKAEHMASIKTSRHEITVSGDEDVFSTSLSETQLEEGIDLIQIRIVAEEPASPPVFTLSWTHPLVDIHVYWRTAGDHNKSLVPGWTKGFVA